MKITKVTKAGTRQVVAASPVKRAGRGAGADRLALSRQAVAQMEATARRQMSALETPAQREAKDQFDILKTDRRTQAQCRKIAARIRAGDHVPPQDRRYLQEYDSMSYQLAMAMRHVKARPRHWASAIKDAHKPSAGGVAAVLASNGAHGPANRGNPYGKLPQEEEKD